MRKPSLDIVIVNWNTGKQLEECIDSIKNAHCINLMLNSIVIVDNASSDDSMINLRRETTLPIKIIDNLENLGFGAACNQGARNCSSDYILFLNPDTLLYSDSLSVPISFMEKPQNRTVGICSIKLMGETDVQRNCARFPTPRILIGYSLGINKLFPKTIPSHLMSEFDHESSREVDQVIGAFFLIRRQLFEELNGFDEKFFVYFEEVDLSYRAKQKGWSSFYCAEATAFHKGGGSSSQVKALRLFYSLRSRIIYSFKHFSLFQAWVVYISSILFEPFARVAYCLVRGKFKDAWLTVEGFSYFFLAFRDILRQVRS
jgi:N-acetylglucosaminyl-diphospho-decaprenol L-rhamnosyltransferase